jgi:hypothetical protein
LTDLNRCIRGRIVARQAAAVIGCAVHPPCDINGSVTRPLWYGAEGGKTPQRKGVCRVGLGAVEDIVPCNAGRAHSVGCACEREQSDGCNKADRIYGFLLTLWGVRQYLLLDRGADAKIRGC